MGSRITPSQIPFESNKYEWLEFLGGNMADVYLARELRTERHVIIKVLKAEYCNEAELQLRFAQEARLACQCQHPNIVATFYTDEEAGRPFIAMEHLEGETVRALIQRGGIETQEQAFWIGFQLSLALGYLQTAQIVHRDLKPDNVVVDLCGCAKLLDFGVARLKDSRLTEFGVRIGTLRYMSPEQVKSEPLTFSSDMYALGVFLFEMLTLQLPYQAENVEDFFGVILRSDPNLSLLRNVQVPEEVISVIQRCLEKDPAKRFSSFAQVSAILRNYLLPERLQQCPPPTPIVLPPDPPARKTAVPLRWYAIAALFLACVAAATFWFFRRPPPPPVSPPRSLHLAAGDMVLVDAGTALLGPEAKPQMVQAFYIDVTDVTNNAYLAFCRQSGHAIPPAAQQAPGTDPVVNVSFDDAKAFASWAHERLPTAIEWEKAARGSNGQKFPWGNEWRPDAANIPLNRAAADNAAATPASSFPSGISPVGALNMIGNVWEWVNTPIVPDQREFQVLSKDFSPPLAPTEPFYQTKGGSFRYLLPKGQEAALVYDERSMPARARQSDLGFRCAKDL
jgi:serine/threonine protein kinase